MVPILVPISHQKKYFEFGSEFDFSKKKLILILVLVSSNRN
jgi:hypothetical protein